MACFHAKNSIEESLDKDLGRGIISAPYLLAIEAILGILEDPYNYKFYYAIMSALDDLGGYDKYKDRIREASHQAIMNHQEIK